MQFYCSVLSCSIYEEFCTLKLKICALRVTEMFWFVLANRIYYIYILPISGITSKCSRFLLLLLLQVTSHAAVIDPKSTITINYNNLTGEYIFLKSNS